MIIECRFCQRSILGWETIHPCLCAEAHEGCFQEFLISDHDFEDGEND